MSEAGKLSCNDHFAVPKTIITMDHLSLIMKLAARARAQFTSKDMGFIVLSGVAGALSWVFYFAALKLADASKVAPVDKASVLIVMVLATLFLGEKMHAFSSSLVFYCSQ